MFRSACAVVTLMVTMASGLSVAHGQCEIARLLAAEPAASDWFGDVVALGDGIAVAGAWGDGAFGLRSGAVHVFREAAGQWSLETTLRPADAGEEYWFSRFALALDGDRIMVGAQGADDLAGLAYVFRYDGAGWVQEARLQHDDPLEQDRFGGDVGLDGDVAIVGAWGVGASGAAFIYRLVDGVWTQEARLKSPEPTDISFGWRADIDGDTAVVTGAGSVDKVYVFHRDADVWTLEATLRPDLPAPAGFYGVEIAIDGERIVVGSRDDAGTPFGAGAAYVYRRDDGGWPLEDYLTPAGDSRGQGFGESVDIDGDVIVVGSPRDALGAGKSGSAAVFERVGSDWQPRLKVLAAAGEAGDNFASAVGVSATNIFVGASWTDVAGPVSGAAFVYSAELETDCDASLIDDDCELMVELTFDCNANGANDRCDVVAGSDDCNDNGVPDECDNDCNANGSPDACDIADGIAQDRNANLVPDECESFPTCEEVRLDSPGGPGDAFGVSIAAQGDVMVVGAPYDDTLAPGAGAVWVYRRRAGVWSVDAQLFDPSPAGFRLFGYDVDLDGDRLIVGAPGTTGAVVVFRLVGDAWTLETTLEGDGTDSGAFYGISVAIEGTTVVAGAPRDYTPAGQSGAAYVFSFDGAAWHQAARVLASDADEFGNFGWAVGLDAGQAVIADLGSDPDGAVYVFESVDGVWSETARIAPSTASEDDRFGTQLAIEDDRLIVGFFDSDSDERNDAKALVYRRDEAGWTEEALLVASPLERGTNIRGSVAIEGTLAVIGSNLDTSGDLGAGAVYVFRRYDTTWVHETKLIPRGGALGDGFGVATALSDGEVFTTSEQTEDDDEDLGSAHVIRLEPRDCNRNGICDDVDLIMGTSGDLDGDGVPDECAGKGGDLDGDGDVDIADLLRLLMAWGPCDGCPEDLNANGAVDGVDLWILLAEWG